jgi:hypothetical protein
MRPSGTDKAQPRTTPTRTNHAPGRRGLQRGEGLALALLTLVMAGGWLLALHG